MKKIISIAVSVFCTLTAAAQDSFSFTEENIPLKKVTLYSSGVAHYLHEGTVTGSGKLNLFFSPTQINDVLKSLIFMDPAAKELSIDYESEDTLRKALESLKVTVSSFASIYDILKAQKGAEIEILTPNKITGKILSVDSRATDLGESFFISVVSKEGVRIISFDDIETFKFTDEKLNEDLNTALDLILNASSKTRKQIAINVQGTGSRTVRLSYVMEAPVWKPSYRIDMAANSAAFQAWAIVDNSTDLDWKDIKLTLTTGRPVGFRQNLYQPYYTYRPEVPLAIAQTAEAETFDSVAEFSKTKNASEREEYAAAAIRKGAPESPYDEEYSVAEYEEATAYFKNKIEQDGAAGEMFAFTPVKPVTLNRQKSTMIPLALVSLPAEKFSVFSEIPSSSAVNSKFCIEFENKSGLKLPPGPISVFDNGKYAGDALLEFVPENEKRIIAFGDDLEVAAYKSKKTEKNIETVVITDGVLTVTNKFILHSVYTVKNTDKQKRTVVIEHPIDAQFNLLSEENLMEKTANKYRFKIHVDGQSNADLTVTEEKLYNYTKTIFNMPDSEYVSISVNSEMPENVQKIFEGIIKEKEKINSAKMELSDLQNEFDKLSAEQDRVRKNIAAVGSESQQGKEFLNKLLKLENNLDELKTNIASADKKLKFLQSSFKEYLKNIKL